MKIFTLILMILVGYYTCAQKSIFVRVYDLSGKKNYKGNVTSLSAIGSAFTFERFLHLQRKVYKELLMKNTTTAEIVHAE